MMHKVYNARDQAFVRHNGTMAEMRGGLWVPLPSLPDYEGLIMVMNAKHVAFDAKLRSEMNYYHPKDKLHQTQYLYDVDRAGGIAFLLIVVIGVYDCGFMLWPQDYWQAHHDKGFSVRLGMGIEESLGVPVPAWDGVLGGYIPDWLKVCQGIDKGSWPEVK